MEEALTEFLFKVVLPFLWFFGITIGANLLWLRAKSINFAYVAYLIPSTYFAILYFQGEGWAGFAWGGIMFLLWISDMRFAQYYDFLRYDFSKEARAKKEKTQSRWRKEKSYKNEETQSRWKSWREKRKQEKEEEKRWEEFKQKNRSNFNNDRNRFYEEKRERTYPKDEYSKEESRNFNQEKTKNHDRKWREIDKMSQSEIKAEWNLFFKITDRDLTKEETDRMTLLKNSLSRKKKSSWFKPP